MKMYTVHDAAAKAYLPPFTTPSERDALASFKQASEDTNSNICKFSSDFTLIEIGEFDERTNVLTAHKAPITIINAAKFKEAPNV